MHNRRNFLKTTLGIGAGSLFLPKLARSGSLTGGAATAYSPAPGSLASSAVPAHKVRDIGIQLYSVRTEMLADPVATLKRLARIGFKELESARSDKGNYYGLSAKEIKKITEDLGMKLRSGHILVDNNWQKSIDEAAETGQGYLITAVLPTPGQTVENYQRSAETFSKYGEDCEKAGLSFGYHNHSSEFDVVDGKILYDILVERSDPKLVKMEMDLGWVIAAGHDPLQYFDKYPGRFELWHLKDMDMTLKTSTEFGKGSLDIKKLMQHEKQSGMKYFFLEQEEYAHDAFESVEFDYNYLVKLDY